MIRVAALTAGRDAATARFRVRQYIPALARLGIDVREMPATFGAFPPRARAARPLWGGVTLAERAVAAARTWRCDVTLLQREAISTLLTVEALTRRPRVLDVDDAIWLTLGEARCRRLAGLADLVICGNAHLAEWFGRRAASVTMVPTVVDTERWRPADAPAAEPVVVWSGGSGGFGELEAIAPAIADVLRRVPGARLRVVSERSPVLRAIPAERLEFVRWSPGSEVASLATATVGIMPLADTPWNRGKCGFKMLLYMACGLAVVASPVGVNAEILGRGPIGRAATDAQEWSAALAELLGAPSAARGAGAEGRRVVTEHYALDRTVPVVAGLLRDVAERR